MTEEAFKKAIDNLTAAAKRGEVAAQFNLASVYALGQGLPKDEAKALYWCRKAAKQGYAQAQYNLGLMYGKGQGTSKKTAKAQKWFLKAAEQGLPEARAILDVQYASGKRVPGYKGRAELEHRLRLKTSAEQGDAQAQFCLGLMYWSGQGQPKDEAKAKKWLRKSAAQGHHEAADIYEKLRTQKTDRLNEPPPPSSACCLTALFHMLVTLPLNIIYSILSTTYQFFIAPFKNNGRGMGNVIQLVVLIIFILIFGWMGIVWFLAVYLLGAFIISAWAAWTRYKK